MYTLNYQKWVKTANGNHLHAVATRPLTKSTTNQWGDVSSGQDQITPDENTGPRPKRSEIVVIGAHPNLAVRPNVQALVELAFENLLDWETV